MVTLKINNIEVSVPRGGTILEAAEKAGVFVPTLCHDKRITPYGSCRLCVVEERRKPGNLIPSCFTPAREGMDIITETPAILDAIRMQLQLILVNHPLECPICDKAGECTLQNLVIRYNITEAPHGTDPFERYIDLQSPLIERNMTRCVLCGRCVRICGELQGRDELDFINRGYRTYIGTDGGRPLDCDFCGLCVSTCPVGALNDRLFKNSGRVWNLEHRTNPCSHCGLGCHLDYHLEKGRLRRITPITGMDGKKGIICVRGAFGWRSFESKNRSSLPLVRQGGTLLEASWDEAIGRAAQEIKQIHKKYGGSAIALLTADHLTNEEAGLCGTLFHDTLDCCNIGSLQAAGYRQIISVLQTELGESWRPGNLQDLNEAEIILVLGGGATELHPALKPIMNGIMRQEGRELVVLASWPDDLSKLAELSLMIAPENVDNFIAELRNALSPGQQYSKADVAGFGIDTCALARCISLIESKRPMVVLVTPNLFGSSEHKALLAATLSDRAKSIIPLGAQVNSAGAIFQSGLVTGGACLRPDTLLAAIEAGQIRALYLAGDDPLETMPDPVRVRKALAGLELIICQSPFKTAVTELAHIVLPSAVMPEKSGSIRSLLGHENKISPVISPLNACRTDLEIFRSLTAMLTDASQQETSVPREQLRREIIRDDESPFEADGDHSLFSLRLTAIPSIFGDGILTRQSPEISDVRKGLKIIMNVADFELIGIKENEPVEIFTPYGNARAEAAHDANMPRGRALLRHAMGDEAGLSLIRYDVPGIRANVKRTES